MPTTEEVLLELELEMQDMEYYADKAVVLFYGESGVGKTVDILTLAQKLTPPDKLIIYFDSAQGYASTNNHPELKRRVKRVQYRTVEQVTRYVKAIDRGLLDIGCIVLDEASGIADMDLDGVVRSRAAKDPSKDPDSAKQPDMGTSTNRIKKMYSDLLALPDVHILSTAHIRKDKDDSGFEVWSPEFLPKEGRKIRQLMHIVAFMTLETVKKGDEEPKQVRVFQVHPSNTRVAKTRVGGMNPKVTYKQLETQLVAWLNSGGKLEDEVVIPVETKPVASSEPTDEGVEI